MRFLPAFVVACALSGCAVTDDDDPSSTNGKADGDGTCADPLYGDGTCQIDLPCGIPDIDCFVTFATDAEAAAWSIARYPASTVGETDPVFSKARTLLDRAWEMFRTDVPLGKLAEQRLAAVVIEDPDLNAYAMADGAPGKAGFVVQMNRGLFTHSMTDDEIIGVLLHEIAHIVKLHVVTEVKERTRRYYIASSPEQIGATTPEVERAKHAGTAWREAAGLIGIISDPALDAAPFDGNLGALWSNYGAGTCSMAVWSVHAATDSITNDRLSGGYTLPSDLSARIGSALAAVRTCSGSDPKTLRAKLAELHPDWPAYLTPLLAADELALLDRPYLEATLALTAKRRAELRAIEIGFTSATGAPWSALRYFSTEEEADDYAARIAARHHLATDGSAGPSLVVLAEQRPACEAAIAAGTTPYGARLTDEHHGDCWRVMHARQIASAAATAPASTARTTPPTPWTPTRIERPRPVY